MKLTPQQIDEVARFGNMNAQKVRELLAFIVDHLGYPSYEQVDSLRAELEAVTKERDEACRYRDAKAAGTWWPTVAVGIADAEQRGYERGRREAVEALVRLAEADLWHNLLPGVLDTIRSLQPAAPEPVCDHECMIEQEEHQFCECAKCGASWNRKCGDPWLRTPG